MSHVNSQTTVPKEPSGSSATTYAIAGAMIGGAAAALVLRGRGTILQRMATTTTTNASSPAEQTAVLQAVQTMNTSFKELQQSVSLTESRLGTKLQTQERAISQSMGSHYKDLNHRLDTINAARTELSGMARKTDDLQTIFISPRRRGAFGELQLEAIIADVMHPGSYEFQSTLLNGKRPDCLLRLPHPIGNLCIDSKFPMDSFIELTNVATNSAQELLVRADTPEMAAARKKLSQNLRKHVRDIAEKYIVPGETADCALLFLPSEAIFAEIVEHHSNIVTEAHRTNVWIACPTTLMAVLTTMRGVVRGIQVSERADAIVAQVGAIIQDVDRLITRSEKVEKNVENALENLRLMRVSSNKVRRGKEKLDVLHEKEEDEVSSSTLLPTAQASDEETSDDDQGEQLQRAVA